MGNNIILDPYPMFGALNDLEEDTKKLEKNLKEIGDLLQIAAKMTYAIGFSDQMDEAENGINNVGNAAISAHNAIAFGCSDVVNKLVNKFATEAGARASYTVAPFPDIKIQTNFPDRVRINPHYLKSIFEQINQKQIELANIIYDMEFIFKNTNVFWQGTAADATRQKFKNQAMPFFDNLMKELNEINDKGVAWVDDAIKMEASIQTP